MKIREIPKDKDLFLPLLLQADPSEEKIVKYLRTGRLLAGFRHGQPVCCAVLGRAAAGGTEIRNLAVVPHCRRQGLGGQMLRHIWRHYTASGLLTVRTGSPGAGEPPFYQELFYCKHGFALYRREKGYFLRHYPQAIYEDDSRRVVDRISLRRTRL